MRPPTCEDPGTPMHAVRLGNTYTEGSKLQFLCQPPYHLVGSEFRVCQANKKPGASGDQWTARSPSARRPSAPSLMTSTTA